MKTKINIYFYDNQKNITFPSLSSAVTCILDSSSKNKTSTITKQEVAKFSKVIMDSIKSRREFGEDGKFQSPNGTWLHAVLIN